MDIEVALHTGDPGIDRKNEATYGGYHRMIVPASESGFLVRFPGYAGGPENVITHMSFSRVGEPKLYSLFINSLWVGFGIVSVDLKISAECFGFLKGLAHVRAPAPDLSRWPIDCPRCRGPAYQGAGAVECMNRCSCSLLF